MALNGEIDAIATAPIHKEAAQLAGYNDIGHMELLQKLSGAKEVATMLTAGNLRVVHLTTHRSLAKAVEFVKRENVLAKIELTYNSFREWGFSDPRIAVAALNPHGGDGGLIGREEIEEIVPAVNDALALGINVTGPIPADSVFPQAINDNYRIHRTFLCREHSTFMDLQALLLVWDGPQAGLCVQHLDPRGFPTNFAGLGRAPGRSECPKI